MTRFKLINEMINVCQELIRIPSISGEEKEIADFIANFMKLLQYNVWRDEVGNVIGYIPATDKSLPSIMFTTHLDHVNPGDLSLWKYDPYAGNRDQDWIYGVGASDAKGAVATQIFIKPLLQSAQFRHGDIYVAFVVCEEVGGVGTQNLLKSVVPNFAIMGEATSNEIRNANRGRALIKFQSAGRRQHASATRLGESPIYQCAVALKTMGDVLEKYCSEGLTIVPTRVQSSQCDLNVIPDRCEVFCDCRFWSVEDFYQLLNHIHGSLPKEVKLDFVEQIITTYTGKTVVLKHLQPPFYTSFEDPFLVSIKRALEESLERSIPVKPWNFTTDCGFFQEKGVKILGFSPGEEKYAHTSEDRVNIKLMIEALQLYPTIIKTINSLS